MHAHDQELASFLSSSSFSVSAAATSLHPILEVWSKLEIHILDNVRILKRLYDSKQPERLTQMRTRVQNSFQCTLECLLSAAKEFSYPACLAEL
jgi:hypothetical protein